MRIAFISGKWPFTWGGSEVLWGLAAHAARAAGHSVLVSVAGSRPDPPELTALADAGVRVHRQLYVPSLALQRRLNHWRFPFAAITSFRPDVVCLGQAGADDFCVQYGLRTVEQLTDGWRTPHVVVCQYNDDAYVPTDAIRRVGHEVYGRAARLVVISDANLRAYRRQFAHSLQNGQRIYNPVNLANRAQLPWLAEGDSQVIGFVGRLDARSKGLDLLLEALSWSPWADRKWTLRLVGDGPDREYLGALVELYGLIDRVEFVGWQTDVRQVWARCHLCVSPSRAEGMPMALLEALVCGRPAVATDCGAAREWVLEGQTGYLAAGPTVGAIAEALDRAWADRQRWPAVGFAAHAHTAPLTTADPGRTLLDTLTEVAGRS